MPLAALLVEMDEFPLVDEFSLILLFVVIWAFEIIFLNGLRASPLIGQILAGILLGPALLDIVPFVDALRLLGKIGGRFLNSTPLV